MKIRAEFRNEIYDKDSGIFVRHLNLITVYYTNSPGAANSILSCSGLLQCNSMRDCNGSLYANRACLSLLLLLRYQLELSNNNVSSETSSIVGQFTYNVVDVSLSPSYCSWLVGKLVKQHPNGYGFSAEE